ncbi:response regulator [Sphingomonas panni]|uniref:response regulator n=1 Tax=Sphingomonas panni TaxID=237612 RepID=UPI001F5B88A9
MLIIEDDWLIADHIAQLVEAAGASSIDMADSEDDAIARASRHAPAVIISDVSLGAGGHGPTAVQKIITMIGERPVLFVTGEPRDFQPPSSSMRVLHKPVEDRVLVANFQDIAPLP